jgi:hypothetical protein
VDKTLTPPAGFEGWIWFRPKQDAEKLALMSDTGVLGLFGIRQARNRDQALFPLLPFSGLNLTGQLGGRAGERTRAEVVQMQGDELWVLAAGSLQRFALAWHLAEGPMLVPGWKEPLELGSPLHASQAVEDPSTGRSTLFLVTQPSRRQSCWVSAVEDGAGTLLWRRQLGLVCATDPLLLNPGKGNLVVLAQDQGGALFDLDPDRFPQRKDFQWQLAGKGSRLIGSLDDGLRPPILLPGQDGKSAYHLAFPGDGTEMVVRAVGFQKGQRRLQAVERRVKLPAPLGGTPAVVGAWMILPLQGDDCVRLPLPLPAGAIDLVKGPLWRADLAAADAQGHVVALGNDRFLMSDGLRGLTCYRWGAQPNDWAPMPTGQDGPTLTLSDRLVGAPLVLPRQKAGDLVRVCVADAGGQLTLLEVQGNGALKTIKSWDLQGQANAGPFLRTMAKGEARIGCVVKGSRLVWIDPNKTGPRWVYRTPSGEAIVGMPQVVEGSIVVADQSGLYVGLDPLKGTAIGRGHQLKGSVAPASAPVGFGPGRLLAPLTDGTALLLQIERLRNSP